MAGEFDFKAAVAELIAPENEYDRTRLHLWGGVFAATEDETLEARLSSFVEVWEIESREMPWRIWEFTGRIDIYRAGDPDLIEWEWLERARFFGKGGDLNLRRDGDRIYWHFISDSGAPPFGAPEWGACNFWDETEHQEVVFRRREEKSMLWGAYDLDRPGWHDDRVAKAQLKYPFDAPRKRQDRAVIKYRIFSDGGEDAFVWWLDLEVKQ